MATRAKSEPLASAPPTGAVTFLFSDIEGSTRRWELHGSAMNAALRLHDALIRAAVDRYGGRVFKTAGDAVCAAFSSAKDAAFAALAAQRAISQEDWSALGGLHVRMGIHTGKAEERDGDYFGPTLNRLARLVAIGHGDQTLISGSSARLIRDRLPAKTRLRHLGLHNLRDFEEAEEIYQLVADGLRVDFPPLRSPEALRGNLPLQLTNFIGRDLQVVEINALLSKSRLVAIVGAGGIGKTRIAVKVAAEIAGAYSDGTWFIDLAPIADPSLVEGALASVFNVRPPGGARPLIDEVALALRDKSALLIFDNCEQVAAAAAGTIANILLRCPKIAVVATSREPLGVDGEETYRMAPLSVPPEGEPVAAREALRYEAVALFVARATSAQKTFVLTDANARFVTEIVRRLDGIPLAIELAAPRLQTFSVRDLAKHLGKRFQLLTSGSHTALPRHKTLRALIEWSYELLGEPEQRLFRRLSIFRGSFALDAAQAVCADDGPDREEILPLMAALVEKSLVATEPSGEELRYRMLESTRYYGSERLTEAGESDAAASRHCRYFVDAADRAWSEGLEMLSGPWLGRHRPELENYRAAIDWGLIRGRDVRAGAAIVVDLRKFWDLASPSEGRKLLERAMAAVEVETAPTLHGRLVITAALLDQGFGRTVRSADLAQAAAAFTDGADRVHHIDALFTLGFFLGRSGEIEEALLRLDEALVLARSQPYPRLIAIVLSNMASWLSQAGDQGRARAALDEAMAIYRRDDDRDGIASVLLKMAETRFFEHDIPGALADAKEALAIARALNDERILLCMLHNAAAYLLAAGNVNEAARYARESLAIAVRRGAIMPGAFAMEDLAQVNARCGDLERAARVVGYTSSIYSRQGVPREFTEQVGYDRTMSILRAELSEDRLTTLLGEGAGLDETSSAAEAMASSVSRRPGR